MKKHAVISAILLLLIGAALIAFKVFASPVIGFAYYEPTYLPPNVTITDKRISINDNGEIRHERASLRLETTAWTYSINQFNKGSIKIEDADQNYDETSIKPTCSKFKTPKQIEYRLCHWVDDWESHGGGKVSVNEIKFFKGSTYFWGRIPTNLDQTISVEEISRFIDSFERKSTDGIPVKGSQYFT